MISIGTISRRLAQLGTAVAGMALAAFTSASAVVPAYLVKDLNSSPGAPSIPIPMGTLGNLIFFKATVPETGSELYRSDGTEEGTFLLKDILSDPNAEGPRALAVLNGVAYFIVQGGQYSTTDAQLWKTDGTSEGTTLVKSYETDASIGVQAYTIQEIGGKLYMSFFRGGDALQVSDGMSDETISLIDYPTIIPEEPPIPLIPFKQHIYFNFIDQDGEELWRTDGTPEGTGPFKYLLPGTNWSMPGNYLVFGDHLYFVSSVGLGDTVGFWKSDGTSENTVIVWPPGDPAYPFQAASLGIAKDKVIFFVRSTANVHSIWATDGTMEGTHLLRTLNGQFINLGGNLLLNLNGICYFQAPDAGGFPLWRSDATPEGTYPITPVDGTISASGVFTPLPDGRRFVFSASRSDVGSEVFISDGTNVGTKLLADVYTGSTSSNPGGMTVTSTHLFFRAVGEGTGMEPWAIRLSDIPADVTQWCLE